MISFCVSIVQIAPVYLASCPKQGFGLLEILLYRQPVQHDKTLLKVIYVFPFTNVVHRFPLAQFLYNYNVKLLLAFSFFFPLNEHHVTFFVQNLEICRLYELDNISSCLKKVFF